jgi:hypothetical protein
VCAARSRTQAAAPIDIATSVAYNIHADIRGSAPYGLNVTGMEILSGSPTV